MMETKWIVLKFGGTSVAGRRQWDTIAQLASERRDSGYRVLLVCSAVAGVTNRLSELAELAANPAAAKTVLDEIEQLHCSLAEQLGVDTSPWLPKARAHIEESLRQLAIESGPRHRAALMATGEWMSTQMGAAFLARSLEVDWVDAREALHTVEELNLSPARRWLSATCQPGFDPELEENWRTMAPVLITQGFIARVEDGSTALLGRGGSDTSAALMAGRLDAEELEIWTDVPGLFTADPRLIDEARMLNHVEYAEALEMAAGGARVIHPRCIRAAAETTTALVIRDINRLWSPGTRIDHMASSVEGIKTITCKANMVVLLLHNLDVRHEVGFLAGVFEVFRRLGISVDLVATSETTTTLAFSRETNHLDEKALRQLVDQLSPLCRVKTFDDCVTVNLVGRGARRSLGGLSDVTHLFEDVPLLMASQSANDMCLSLLVHRGAHEPLLIEAHRALVPRQGDEGDRFGISWKEIRELDAGQADGQ